jgi:hypothetical protein
MGFDGFLLSLFGLWLLYQIDRGLHEINASLRLLMKEDD